MQVSKIDLDRLIYIIYKLETHKLVLFECLGKKEYIIPVEKTLSPNHILLTSQRQVLEIYGKALSTIA